MQKITPFLWFDSQAEEAANFYTSIFKNSKIGTVSRYGEVGPGPKGTVMLVTFQLDGEEFMAPIRCGLRNESGRARRSATADRSAEARERCCQSHDLAKAESSEPC
jgi:uncharacterized glyoxalase superfamily protein PhnB